MNIAEPIVLSTEEQTRIQLWAHGRSFPLRLVQRAKVIQMAAEGKPSPDCGQLWYTQTSSRTILAQTASTIPPAFYSNFEFLVEPDRALVSRNYGKTYPSQNFQKRTRLDCRYRRVSGQSQSKPSGFHMERP